MIDETLTCSGLKDDWVKLTQKAAEEECVFDCFRSYDIAKLIVDGYPAVATHEYLKKIKAKKYYASLLNLWEANDSFMGPEIYIYYEGKKLTPATGRHLVNVNNYIELFGKTILTKSICEIGAGWGGECVLMQRVKDIYFPKKYLNYTIFDLSTSVGLIEKFTSKFAAKCTFSNLSIIQKHSFDLVISNGAYSEMGRELQEEYFRKVISKSRNGYFITNFDTHSIRLGGFSTVEFLKKLKSVFKNVYMLDIEEYLSSFDKNAGSKLIIFMN